MSAPAQVLADVGDDRGDRGLLVPGGDEDESPHAADSPTKASQRPPARAPAGDWIVLVNLHEPRQREARPAQRGRRRGSACASG